MLKIGITGSIGSGKTTVCKVFENLGIPVYNADLESRKLVDTDPSIREALIKRFGSGILHPDQSLNRKQLAATAFADAKGAADLNSITHPPVLAHFDTWAALQLASPYVIKEAALMFESDSYKQLDAVIFVACPEELRIHRAMSRDHSSREEVLARMKNQWPDEDKRNKAQYVINNDEQHLLIPQVLQLHRQFLENRK